MPKDKELVQVKRFLGEQIKLLKDFGGVSKISGLPEDVLKEIESVIFDFPKLQFFVLENNDKYDVFFRYKTLETTLEIGDTFNSAKSKYMNNNYGNCLSKLLLILKSAAYPKAEVYELTGITYMNMGDMEKANDYLRIANYINGEKDYNIVDYDKVKERVEENMKQTKKNIYSQYNYDSDRQIHIDKLSLPALDELVDFIKENHLDIETAGKNFELTEEQIDFVKLIFARECYKQGDIERGNIYLKSVEEARGKTSDVTRLCLEARTNRKFFQYRENNEPIQLPVVKPGKRKVLNPLQK